MLTPSVNQTDIQTGHSSVGLDFFFSSTVSEPHLGNTKIVISWVCVC